jgi:MFS family permease
MARPSPIAITFAGVLSLAAAMGIGRFSFTPMLPLMIAEGHLGIAAGGWVAAANYAGYLAGAMTASRLRWSTMRLSITSLALTALLTAAMGLPLPVWWWAALRFAAGVSSAWAFVSTAIWCLGALARESRGDLAGAAYSGVGVGIAGAGLYCLAGAANGSSASSLWLQLGLLVVVLMVPVVIVLRRLNGGAAAPPPRQPAQAASAPRNREDIRGLVICYGALGFGYILPATFLPVMARSLVDDPRVFGLAWPVFGLTGAISTFVAAWVLRRASRLSVWSVSNVLMGIGVLLPSIWLSAWTIALSALCVGGTFMIVTLAGVQEVRARAHGDATPLVARMTTSFALGQIAGPIASSLLLHVPGFAARGLDLALQLSAASLFASAAWLWRAHRSHDITRQEVPHAR